MLLSASIAESVALQFGRCTKAQRPKCFKASINQWLRIPSLHQQIAPVLMLGFDEEEREFTKKRNHEEEHRCGTDSCDSSPEPTCRTADPLTRRFQDFMTLVFGHGDAGGWSLSLWVTDGVPTNTGAQTCVGELWPQLPLTMSGRVARRCCVSVKLCPISWCSAPSPQRSATRSDAHRRRSASLLMMFL